ncbi:hypothetical protein RHGRI_020630 [Rhododendron griersonianum]|uniref:Uncharacterized protein n=1 Tax=Rhododendron griersonianum TaxID=479676 RepID=A0AAV6JH26_9ERIC|nr:hypothetical protein RHGRI_020630 [Rhododendron griersonianum]
MRVPPMNTAGAPPADPSAEGGRAGISSSSNSMAVGWTPMEERRLFMTWHMQQEDRLKTTTGFSDISRRIRVSAVSDTSMASEELVVGVSSSRTPPSRSPCIAGAELEREREREREVFVRQRGEGDASGCGAFLGDF